MSQDERDEPREAKLRLVLQKKEYNKNKNKNDSPKHERAYLPEFTLIETLQASASRGESRRARQVEAS